MSTILTYLGVLALVALGSVIITVSAAAFVLGGWWIFGVYFTEP